MNYYDYLKYLFALILVLSLMGGLAFVLKRFGHGQGSLMAAKNRRLKIIEILPIDAKHKTVLIQRDDTQHLVLFSQNGDTVIETNIKPIKINPDDK